MSIEYPGLPEGADDSPPWADETPSSAYEVRREYGDILCRYAIYHSNGGFVGFAATLWGARRRIGQLKRQRSALQKPPTYRESA